MNEKNQQDHQAAALFISAEGFRQHWQSHRQLTRRTIEAFPESELFHFSLGGMRPFAQQVMEIIHLGAPAVRGIVTRQWPSFAEVEQTYSLPADKKSLLALWDQMTDEIDALWPSITEERLFEIDKVFGMWEGPVRWGLLYFLDNEIHHRAQGYVYLRALGIEPPAFWDRKDPVGR